MRKLYLILPLFICLSSLVRGQNFGNEWIDYNRQYYKIYVHADGIYRVSYNLMQSAGIPVQSIDPRSLQLFCKGVEQYIYVKGETDGALNPGDYIEFAGKMNDGTFDTQLYDHPLSQANPNYSLFCDSAVYFLTWNSSVSNRRMTLENDVNFNAYTPVSYFNRISRQDYTSAYFNGKPYNGITDPVYTSGEGWFDNGFSLGGSISKTIPTSGKYSSGSAEVDFILIGASDYSLANPDHHVRIQFGNTTIDTVFEGYKMLRIKRTIPVSQLGSSTTGFSFTSVNNIGSGADRNTIPYIQIKYPHAPNLDNATSFRFFVPDGFQAKSLFNFTGLAINSGDTARLYDITNHKRIKLVYDGTSFRGLIPNAGNEKECFITSDGAITAVTHLVPVSANGKFINYLSQATAENTDYIIVSNNQLISETENYRLYRNSTGYHTMLADVDHLYDQFSYGILKDPMGIRNFMRYAWANFPQKPKHLFLIGKAFRAGYDNAYVYRKSLTYWNQTLVPSIGNPPSDLLFTTGINDTMYTPAVPTGRLSARTADQVRIYLDKVQGYELAEQTPQEWMKNVIHFGGGSGINEQTTFAAYLSSYKNIIEDTLFGGYVRTYLKTSSDPIQINQSDSLKNLINGGVSLMTFFGHAGGTGFDVSIDNPSEYNNMDKYPFLLANSCYAGDIYLDAPSSSEAFVLIENKGVIGYLASIALGMPWALNAYSSEFYKNISYKNYGEPVGKSIQQTIKNIQTSDITLKETCLTMTLHGDPAIIINSFSKPDYMVNSSSVYFDPPNVTTEVDSFYMNIITTNLGRALADSFIVQLDRTFPDGTVASGFYQIYAPFFKDTLSVKLPVNIIKGVGLNKFRITLDAYNHMDELTRMNNVADVDLLIKSSDIIPVYPYKYAVIPALPVELKASTGFAFSPAANYRFELDTTDAFNSPVKTSQVINHGGGVVSWNPVFPIMTDSIVYYWRVSIEPTGGNPYNWRESSFQYIQNKQGWGQAHFFQYKNDDYTYVTYNKPQRKFEFTNNLVSLYCQTFYTGYNFTDQYYRINAVQNYMWAYNANANMMILSVFDPITGIPWHNPAVGNPTQDGFEFPTGNAAQREAMRAFLDSVPTGYYVLGWSHNNHNAPAWEDTVKQAFRNIGSSNIDILQHNHPYIIFGKKGSPPGSANEVTGLPSELIHLSDSIQTKWTTGHLQSELIGPASKWGSLHWRQKSADPIVTDSVRLCVIGITNSGAIDTLISGLPPDSTDIYNLWSRIDASAHPWLKLIAFMKDDSLHTPVQMKRWQVIYDGAPETALDPSLHYVLHKDTLTEGETLLFSTATHNISNYDMDSLLISYWLIDKDRVKHPLGTFRHRPHPSGDVLMDTITASTTGRPGLNSLWIEVNPNNDQLEQYHFNNIGEVYFYVIDDKVNPLLDVTFDGVHILDGDIVSAKPNIQIGVKDENKFLMLNDTADFKVWLLRPGAQEYERIYFRRGGQEILRFYPASLPHNSCRIEYRAEFPTDGTYQLMAEAQDRSKNISGDNSYKISFEVINKSTITSVMNWPNPFTTATHFVFTLTGSEIPTYFKIQVMTITGKLIKEIGLDELGPIHIGKNITEYAWDGTDQYGDRLANGVYLYRVITRINGNSIENNPTAADQYFTKEFGKMYLMR